MTRAPAASASACDPSVDPLSETTISPRTPSRSRHSAAFCTHTATVSASLRQGMRTVTSTGVMSFIDWDLSDGINLAAQCQQLVQYAEMHATPILSNRA